MPTDAAALAACARSLLPSSWLHEMETLICSSEDRIETMTHVLKQTFTMLLNDVDVLRAHAASAVDDTNMTTPTTWKARGNAHFKAHEYDASIDCFTQGLRALVVRSQASTSLQSILYTNRCAAWMAKTCWQHAYEDASRAIAADPTYAKGWFRRGKALEACHDANPALALALCDGRLQQHDGCNSVVDAVARDLHHAKCLVEGVPSSVTSTYTHAVPAGPKDVGGAGVFHPHVVITTTKTHGRSIQATQAIPPGTVLLTESPTVLAVGTDVAACAACARVSLLNPPLPCDFCSADMYCDESCRAKAWADGHRWECSLTWQHVALDPLCRVYWRLLNRRRFQTNDDVSAQWKKVGVEPNTKGLRLWTTADEPTVHALVHFPPLCHHLPSLSSSSVIHNHQFLALLDPSLDDNVPLGLVHLTPHQDGPIDVRLFVLTRPSKELYTLWLTQLQHVLSSHVKVVLHHAHMDTNLCAGALSAGFRPRSLPSSSEFTWNNPSGRFRGLDTLQSHLRSMPPVVAVETVLFVATLAVLDPWRGYLHDDDAQDMTLSVLLALAGQLPTNVVAITTTTTTAAAAPSSHNLRDVTQTRVGVGVYPRMAMANHSCVPNAFVRFDDGATLHLITSRAIAANDHVYISYGPHASKMDGPARRRHLQGQYFFACSCDACSSNDQVNEPPSDSVFMQRTHAMEAAIVVAIPKAHDDLHHAHELAQKLLHERLANLSNTHVLVGRAHDLVAQIAATRGDFAEAAAHSSKSLAILETHYAPFDAELGHEYLKLAQLLFHAEKFEAVQAPLSRAQAALSLHLPAHDPALSDLDDLVAQCALMRM